MSTRSGAAARMASPSVTPRLLDLLSDTPELASLRYALGEAGTDRAAKSVVAIRGLNAVGVEIARLLLKSGIGEIRVVDEPHGALVTENDVAATDGVYTKTDIGKPRAACFIRNMKLDKSTTKLGLVQPSSWRADEFTKGVGKEEDVEIGNDDLAIDVLITAWDFDSHEKYLDEQSDWLARSVIKKGGAHLLAAAPGFFAFVRATHPNAEKSKKNEKNESPYDSDFEPKSDAAARVDSRLTKAPVSMLESVVPVYTELGADSTDSKDSKDSKGSKDTSSYTRQSTKILRLVTVCDANAHGLRLGDSVVFFDAFETRRENKTFAKVVSVEGLHSFTVEFGAGTLFPDPDALPTATRRGLSQGAYVRQRGRTDFYENDGFDAARDFETHVENDDDDFEVEVEVEVEVEGGTRKRKRASLVSSRPPFVVPEVSPLVVHPFEIQSVSSFLIDKGTVGGDDHGHAIGVTENNPDTAQGTDDHGLAGVPPSVAAARVASGFARLKMGDDAAAGENRRNLSSKTAVFLNQSLKRGARVAFPPCVAIAASLAAHECLKLVSGTQVPLGANGSRRRWFVHDFAELDEVTRTCTPSNRPGVESSTERATGADDAASTNQPAGSIPELLGANLVADIAAIGKAAVVGTGDASTEVWRQIRSLGVTPVPWGLRGAPFPSVEQVSLHHDLDTLRLMVLATEGFSARRKACSLSTTHGFSVVDVGVDNDRVSSYVAAARETAPWSVSGATDPGDTEYPSCVTTNFPHVFAHCAQWARDLFKKQFVELPKRTSEFLREIHATETETEKGKGKKKGKRKEKEKGGGESFPSLGKLAKRFETADLHDARFICGSFLNPLTHIAQSVEWAENLFHHAFHEAPTKALRANPVGLKTKDGFLFWSGAKRAPTPLTFNETNPNHLTFVVAASRIYSWMFRGDGVELSSEYDPTDYDKHDEYSDEYFTRGSYAEVTEQLVKIAVANGKSRALLGVFPDEFTDEESEELAKANVLARFHESLGKTLYSVARVPRPVDEIEPGGFRKHKNPTFAAFIAASAACRGEVYQIPSPSEWDLAFLANGYRPETPAPFLVAAALAAAETVKIAKNNNSRHLRKNVVGDFETAGVDFPTRSSNGIHDMRTFFRCSYVSLGRLAHATASPFPVTTKIAKTGETTADLRFTEWDKITLDLSADRGATLKTLLSSFEKQVGLQPSMVSHGASLLFADFMNQTKPETVKRMSTPLVDLFADAYVLRDRYDESADPPSTTPSPVFVTLAITACDESDDDVDVPYVRVRIR